MSQYTAENTLDESVELNEWVAQPLERVNYTAGMMLSLPAINAEQHYHRQRVNRLQYWFQGAGTLLGLVVKPSARKESVVDEGGVAEEGGEEGEVKVIKDQSLRLVVSPGIAIDGLGRELVCHEPYCVNLRDWLEAQKKSDCTFLRSVLRADEKAIQFRVTIRYQAASSGLQPVLARTINGGIDPVQPSRVKDALLLEILPLIHQVQFPVEPDDEDEPPVADELPADDKAPTTNTAFKRAGLKQNPLNTTAPESWLSKTEYSHITSLKSAQERQLALLQSQLLYGPRSEVGALELEGDYEELSRVLLAVIEIPLRANLSSELSPILHPDYIRINNLVRPFITTPDQLRWLYLQENAS